MAEFHIRDVEGMRQVCIEIRDETVRAARGALSNMSGEIEFTPRLPGLGDALLMLFTSESRIRPFYTGTGQINLQPSLSGYHLLNVADGERWILEPGVYWACEGSIALQLYREPFWASLWAGDGTIVWKTAVAGHGRVAINAPGPVEIVDVQGRMDVQGRLVLGRTDGLRFRSVRSARIPRNFISGQSRLRRYEGTGKALVCWTPYWNQFIYENMSGGERIEGSIFE
jgi:uncharacterized protein (AIM24 family)